MDSAGALGLQVVDSEASNRCESFGFVAVDELIRSFPIEVVQLMEKRLVRRLLSYSNFVCVAVVEELGSFELDDLLIHGEWSGTNQTLSDGLEKRSGGSENEESSNGGGCTNDDFVLGSVETRDLKFHVG